MKLKAAVFLVWILIPLIAGNKGLEPDPAAGNEAPVGNAAPVTPDRREMAYNLHLPNLPSAGTKRGLEAIARIIKTVNNKLNLVDITT